MNYTDNHHLPQWASSDRILMSDFNNAMSAIENGMSANAQAAKSAASAASAAHSKATTALQEALTPVFFSGFYTGTGNAALQITYGFRPKTVIIYGGDSVLSLDECKANMQYFFMSSGEKVLYQFEMNDQGFRVYNDPDRVRYPILNEKGRRYEYIIFR